VKPRATTLLLALCALLALPAFAPAAAAADKGGERGGSLLYVQESAGGSVQRLDSGGFRLRLTGISARVWSFTDRPRRRAGSEGLTDFVGQWGANGFVADPPNAALVLDRGPRSRDVALLTLSHPRYDRGHKALTYRATPLREDAGALASFARRGDPVRAGEFGAASLFVDDGGGAAFTPITLTVTGVTPGQTISVRAAPVAGGRVAWSLGGTYGSGLQFDGWGIPVNSFTLSRSSLSLATGTSSGGETVAFSASLSLEYEETQGVYLTSVSGPGIEITATLPTPSGPESLLLGPNPTLFARLVP
jgi:hypothetical protein